MATQTLSSLLSYPCFHLLPEKLPELESFFQALLLVGESKLIQEVMVTIAVTWILGWLK